MLINNTLISWNKNIALYQFQQKYCCANGMMTSRTMLCL